MASEGSFFCPMIKSLAYGHGDSNVASTLVKEGVTTLGVALIEEGVTLREQGVRDVGLLIFGPFDGEGAKIAHEYGLTPVVSGWKQLESLIDTKKEIQIHIKVNTGMNRLGFEEEKLCKLIEVLKSYPHLRIVGLCSHLSSSEDFFQPNSFTQYQIQKLLNVSKLFSLDPNKVHLFNSAGLISNYLSGGMHSFGARPGISLYGVKPPIDNLNAAQQEAWNEINLRPVMTLKTRIIAVHHLQRGARVSYGEGWIAQRDSVIGVLPVGYADGYHRLFSNRGEVLALGHRVPVVGTVCMDYTMVDLTEVFEQKKSLMGQEVVLFGEQGNSTLWVDEVADKVGTISYEILTGIGQRVPRSYI